MVCHGVVVMPYRLRKTRSERDSNPRQRLTRYTALPGLGSQVQCGARAGTACKESRTADKTLASFTAPHSCCRTLVRRQGAAADAAAGLAAEAPAQLLLAVSTLICD
jgi:hypothetical protein